MFLFSLKSREISSLHELLIQVKKNKTWIYSSGHLMHIIDLLEMGVHVLPQAFAPHWASVAASR